MEIKYKDDYFDNLKKQMVDAIPKDNIPKDNIPKEGIPKEKDNIADFTKPPSTIKDIPVSCITEFKEHVFKILSSNLRDLEESIKEYSVLTPITVRSTGDNSYEVLAGHHRLQACKNLGLATIPCNIVEVDDDTAKIIVINSNRQRGFTDMKPSEIAFALKMEYDALKSQGKRTDLVNSLDEAMQENQISTATFSDSSATNLTSGNDCPKLEMGERNKRNYIRLTSLCDKLLLLVDDDKINFTTGVELSYLSQVFQQTLLWVVENINLYPTLKQAIQLKELSRETTLTEKTITDILKGEYSPKKKKNTDKLPSSIKVKSIKQYIPAEVKTQSELDEYLQKALKHYGEYVANITLPPKMDSDDEFDGFDK